MFQKSVNTIQAPAVAGDLLNDNPVVYSPLTAIAGADGVKVGAFVWHSNVDGQTIGSATGEGAPAGIVQREHRFYNTDITSSESIDVIKGVAFATIVEGDVAVACGSAATVGQVLFVNNTTGAITCANAGSSVEGATETKFKIFSLLGNASEAGQLVGVSAR